MPQSGFAPGFRDSEASVRHHQATKLPRMSENCGKILEKFCENAENFWSLGDISAEINIQTKRTRKTLTKFSQHLKIFNENFKKMLFILLKIFRPDVQTVKRIRIVT